MKKFTYYILSALTLMFVGLKLADKIDWSWWWVFSPVWAPLTAYVLAVVIVQCYLFHRYRHSEQFRRIVDEEMELRKRENRTLADRLKELQEQREKTQGKEDRP